MTELQMIAELNQMNEAQIKILEGQTQDAYRRGLTQAPMFNFRGRMPKLQFPKMRRLFQWTVLTPFLLIASPFIIIIQIFFMTIQLFWWSVDDPYKVYRGRRSTFWFFYDSSDYDSYKFTEWLDYMFPKDNET